MHQDREEIGNAIAQFAACEDISPATLPPDFARNPRIHRTWRLTRLP